MIVHMIVSLMAATAQQPTYIQKTLLWLPVVSLT